MDNGKPQAGMPYSFGGVKRFEKMFFYLGRDSRAVIIYRKFQMRRGAGRFFAQKVAGGYIMLYCNINVSTFTDSFGRISYQVDNNLLYFYRSRFWESLNLV